VYVPKPYVPGMYAPPQKAGQLSEIPFEKS